MATRKVETDATGEAVRANIKRLRKDRWTLRELSERMERVGRPMSHTSLSQIETGARRADVDDLMALAVALDVSPTTLLMPVAESADAEVSATGVGTVQAGALWKWLLVELPLSESTFTRAGKVFDWQVRARQRWAFPFQIGSPKEMTLREILSIALNMTPDSGENTGAADKPKPIPKKRRTAAERPNGDR
ncbi:helix-turn-helix transcriptional regulator [Skermania sp. ID1734]|uniref:helix-turn-helix domain-containing protein n=1 Tax=Skermania sp. ID1734 TaxID=2597516 RepID=UPI00117CE5FE|nr:helix-turn-helix transcriptional regulator [Skermania sp. ID1734]TSE00673.1 helix-turn-helix transcriptional regulator [Skermania sp. ID1734]